MRIGLVGCVKSKLPRAGPARDLYTSALFRGAWCAVERSCERWFILSALTTAGVPGTKYPDQGSRPSTGPRRP
jgi:hypothetical protein